MKMYSRHLLIAAAASVFSLSSYALNSITIDPTSDGSLYVCDTCHVVSDSGYVTVSGHIQGAIKFSSAQIFGQVNAALLTLTPYGLPLFSREVSIYGYGTAISQLDISDANAGTLLGVLTLPENMRFGQDASFDVTDFVRATKAPFLAFNLRATGSVGDFSSLEYNFTHPAQLQITTVAEPEAALLMAFGLAVLTLGSRRNNRTGSKA